jgi:hypothetical protein
MAEDRDKGGLLYEIEDAAFDWMKKVVQGKERSGGGAVLLAIETYRSHP